MALQSEQQRLDFDRRRQEAARRAQQQKQEADRLRALNTQIKQYTNRRRQELSEEYLGRVSSTGRQITPEYLDMIDRIITNTINSEVSRMFPNK